MSFLSLLYFTPYASRNFANASNFLFNSWHFQPLNMCSKLCLKLFSRNLHSRRKKNLCPRHLTVGPPWFRFKVSIVFAGFSVAHLLVRRRKRQFLNYFYYHYRIQGVLGPGPPCPQDCFFFFRIMQFWGSFKEKAYFEQILGSGPPSGVETPLAPPN